jgi:hypothetical protein
MTNPIRCRPRLRQLTMLVVVGLGAMSCGGSDDGADRPATDGEQTVESSRFVGLATDDAVALAESEGRLWRISRDGEEYFAIDASQVEGRVTFEIDDGIISEATIETETGPADTVPADGMIDDPALAQLQADAVLRLVTVDHSFESDRLPFDTVVVSSLIAGDSTRRLEPLALELIAAGIEADAAVTFTQNPDTEIADLAASRTSGVAVVRIDDIRIDADQAEIDLGLWCGTACGVSLTYQGELDADRWTITDIVGPIAVS